MADEQTTGFNVTEQLLQLWSNGELSGYHRVNAVVFDILITLSIYPIFYKLKQTTIL